MRKKESMAVKRGQPRRRVVPVWRSRPALAVLAGVVMVAALGAGWWAWHTGGAARAVSQFRWKIIAASADMGFTVREVLVAGRNQTSREDLRKAVRVARGAPILGIDIDAAKRRVEALPWVASASVERMLPDTVLINVIERQPLVLWQRQGKFSLLDHDGVVIVDKGLERFSDLLVVVGDDAPAHAADLLQVLGTQPALMRKVKAAVRVGGRRWNVRLSGDIDVQLPARDAATAWARLAEFERTHKVLTRDVRILDLRLPDRLIVRGATRNAKPNTRAGGRET